LEEGVHSDSAWYLRDKGGKDGVDGQIIMDRLCLLCPWGAISRS
jgi:hypothetical protein